MEAELPSRHRFADGVWCRWRNMNCCLLREKWKEREPNACGVVWRESYHCSRKMHVALNTGGCSVSKRLVRALCRPP